MDKSRPIQEGRHVLLGTANDRDIQDERASETSDRSRRAACNGRRASASFAQYEEFFSFSNRVTRRYRQGQDRDSRRRQVGLLRSL